MKTETKKHYTKSMNKDSHVITLLRNTREKSGKTHEQIKSETGFAQSYQSRILNGKQYASLPLLIKLGQAIGVDPVKIAAAWKKDKIAEIDIEIGKHVKTT